MREIKYKAWDKQTKTLRDVLLIDWINQLVDLIGGIIERELNEVHLMQYTGLKDKSGTDIYEGDILKRTVTIHVFGSGIPEKDVDEYLEVEYKDEYAGFYISEQPLMAYVGAKYDVWTKCRCTDVEVIGNVYENHELLEVQHA